MLASFGTLFRYSEVCLRCLATKASWNSPLGEVWLKKPMSEVTSQLEGNTNLMEETPAVPVANRETEIWGDSVDSVDSPESEAPQLEPIFVLGRLFSKPSIHAYPSATEQAVVTTTTKRPSKKIIIGVAICLILLAVVICLLVYLLFFESAEDEVKQYMNLSANPCHDFYNYACGGWQAKENAKNSYKIVSLRASLHEVVQSQITDMLKKEVRDGEPKYKSQAKKFFTVCNNIERLEERGTAPFFEFLKMFGKFPILQPTWKKEDTDLQNLITQMTLHGYGPLFRVVPEYALGSAQLKITNAERPGDINIAALEKTLKLLGASDQTSTFRNEFDAMISVHHEASTMSIRAIGEETTVRIQEMKDTIALAFDFNWIHFLHSIAGSKSFNSDTLLVVENRHHIFEYQKRLFQKFDIRDIVNFMMLPLLNFTTLLDPKYHFEVKEKDQNDKATERDSDLVGLRNSPSNTSQADTDGYDKAERTLRCLSEVDQMFSIALRKMYVDEFYSNSLDSIVTDMFQDVKEAYSDEFERSTWLTSATAETTKQIIGDMKEIMGYVENFKDEAFLNELYGQVPADEYFEFVVGLIRHLVNMKLVSPEKLVYKRGDQSMEVQDSLDVDLSYSGIQNTLYLPAASLQKPIINPDWPNSMNYGALGSEIGRVMMTAWFNEFYIKTIDQLTRNEKFGSQGNSYGATQQSKDLMIIKKQRGCYSSVFDGVKEVKGINVPKLGEFCLKSSSGLKASYQAYKLYQYRKGEETKALLGLDLDQDQLFFLAYTQMWCENIPKEQLRVILVNNVLTGSMRVQAALTTSPAFSEAYGCKSGDAMYPKFNCDFFLNISTSV